MLTADKLLRRASGHGTAILLTAALMLSPVVLFGQQPPPAVGPAQPGPAQPAVAPGPQAAPPAAAPAAPKPVAYKALLTDLKAPSGVNVTTEFNKMKTSGVISDPKLLNDLIDFKLKCFIWEARVANLPQQRNTLKADLRAAGGGAATQKKDVHTKLTTDTLKFMTSLVRENYPPVVRYNAILVIGELNASEYNSLTKVAAVPHPEGLAVLMTELENPDQIEAVKAGAILALKRHVEAGIADPALKKKIAQTMLDLVRTVEPPANRSADGHRWLRSRAADLLAAMGQCSLEGGDNQIVLALQAMMTEKDSPWWPRLEALKAMGALDYTGAQGVPYEGIVQNMVELWIEMIEEEAKEVPLSIALQAAAGGGGGMMMPGAMTGGMPGGMPGSDGGASGEGGYAGGYAGGLGMVKTDQYGNPIKPKPDRIVIALKDGYVAILTALNGPNHAGKPDPAKPRGIAAAAAESEKAKQLIAGLETRLKDFKTVLDEQFIEWQARVTQLTVKAVEMKSWLGETVPPIVPTDVKPPAAVPTEVTADAAVPAAQPPANAVPANRPNGSAPPAAAPGTVPATTTTPAATVSATP